MKSHLRKYANFLLFIQFLLSPHPIVKNKNKHINMKYLLWFNLKQFIILCHNDLLV